MLREALSTEAVQARFAAVVLRAQGNSVKVAGAPASPRPSPLVMDLSRRPRVAHPGAHEAPQFGHPVQVLTLFVFHW